MPQTYQSITVNAPIERVWGQLSNFHDMSWAPHVVERCDAVGDKTGTEPGAQRVLNEAFHETLLEVDPVGHQLRYSIDDGPSPVSSADVRNYIGTIHLVADTINNTTLVEWASSWESANDEAEPFCHGIYVALLKDLAQQ